MLRINLKLEKKAKTESSQEKPAYSNLGNRPIFSVKTFAFRQHSFKEKKRKNSKVGTTVKARIPEISLSLAPSYEKQYALFIKGWVNHSFSRQSLCAALTFLPIASKIPEKHDFDLLFRFLQPGKRPKLLPAGLPEINQEILDLLAEAEDNFFLYFSQTCFLFTKATFLATPRSSLLRFSIWSAGLQFVSLSPRKAAASCYIENNLIRLFQLSHLKPSLDTLQSCLILGFVVVSINNPKLHIKWQLFQLAHLSVQLLGIDRPAPLPPKIQQERLLAYRTFIIWVSHIFWSFKVQHLDAKLYMNANIGESCLMDHHVRRNQEDALKFIASECVCGSSLVFIRLHHFFVSAKKESNSISLGLLAIDDAFKEISNIHQTAFYSLIELKVEPHSLIANFTTRSQILTWMTLNYHTSRVQLIDFRTNISFDLKFVFVGLQSAARVLDIIEKDPRVLLRISPIASIIVFIIKHYHAFYDNRQVTLNDDLFALDLNQSLISAYNIFQKLTLSRPNFVFAYRFRDFLDEYLKRFRIDLPHI